MLHADTFDRLLKWSQWSRSGGVRLGFPAQAGSAEGNYRPVAGDVFIDPADVRYEAADRLLTKTSTTVDLNDVPVRVPGATGLLIGTLVHGMVPNPEPSVRWIVDVSMILERDADKVAWDDVVEFARQFRLARRLQAGLQLLAETTGHTAPDGVTAALATLPTTAVERVDRRISAVPEDSIRGRLLQVVAGYAGGDRGLRHVVTGLPSYLAGRWDVRRVRHVPVAGLRALVRWLRRNWLPS